MGITNKTILKVQGSGKRVNLWNSFIINFGQTSNPGFSKEQTIDEK